MKSVICKSDGTFRFSCFLQQLHPEKEITENTFTVVENILLTLVHLLGLWQGVIAGTK